MDLIHHSGRPYIFLRGNKGMLFQDYPRDILLPEEIKKSRSDIAFLEQNTAYRTWNLDVAWRVYFFCLGYC